MQCFPPHLHVVLHLWHGHAPQVGGHLVLSHQLAWGERQGGQQAGGMGKTSTLIALFKNCQP